MGRQKDNWDGYGQAMLDHLHGRSAWEIVEGGDGIFTAVLEKDATEPSGKDRRR